jgi:hypothetical protein
MLVGRSVVEGITARDWLGQSQIYLSRKHRRPYANCIS